MEGEAGKWMAGWLVRHLEDWFFVDNSVLLRSGSGFFQDFQEDGEGSDDQTQEESC